MTAVQTEPVCPLCSIAVDAGYFDSSSIADAPTVGNPEVVLASFRLHPNYCGVLQYFSQFINIPNVVETPELEWQIRCDGEPLAPWLTFRYIINPWGISGFPVHVRLREGCLLEFVVRFVGSSGGAKRVGGRLLGRFWYNTAFGGH